jgi:hypothetical protein
VNKEVIRGSLHVEGVDLGEVTVRFDDGTTGGVLVMTEAMSSGQLPVSEWVPAWIASFDGAPAIAIDVWVSEDGVVEFTKRLLPGEHSVDT